MDLKRSLGMGVETLNSEQRKELILYINLKLASLGLPVYNQNQGKVLELASDLIDGLREKNRILANHHCPIDKRIQNFLNTYLADCTEIPQLPSLTLNLDRHGLAREMAIPADKTEYINENIASYRIKQGVLHNPKSDRRTTKGVFHIAEGGLPIPLDKKAVPKETFAKMLKIALNPPKELLELPFTSSQQDKAYTFVSLMLRPIVSPAINGITPAKTMETRFIAPASLISNLDFVESIFGNAGNPALATNDAALDVEHWTGHTGCVILAPHLTKITKKELGLPHIDNATQRQKDEGMCWKQDGELYNDGSAFKLTCRDENGIIITLISDNYFGYCKKEVKTQIGYAANLLGNVEEEHAGGALAFASYNLGMHYYADRDLVAKGYTFENIKKSMGTNIQVHKEGYAIDKHFDSIVYLNETAEMHVKTQQITWNQNGQKHEMRLLRDKTYIYPTGFKVRLEKHPGANSWRLVGTSSKGTFCHKPATVSGGGKSEISKSIWDAIHFGPIFVNDFEKDMAAVEELINTNYDNRFIGEHPNGAGSKARPILGPARSLGSVIRLLTPSEKYKPEFNQWLINIPNHIKDILFYVKRFYQPEWGNTWKERFSVDRINGQDGHELRHGDRKLVGSFLRVGMSNLGAWNTYRLRHDFIPSEKIQLEDDISSSIVLPAEQLEYLDQEYSNPSVKIVSNCEYRLFQRPDEAIVRGYDKQAESDLASDGSFISNFEPLSTKAAREIVDKAISYESYTEPMKNMILKAAQESESGYFVSSSHPRIVDGKPSKNPRYLQDSPSVINPREPYIADVSTRLERMIPADKPVHHPVNAVLAGRRNNPADKEAGIRALAVYNPIHFQELPELFMDFICSLTGKSPSTTGAGSEGALTKGPFNALIATSDLNNALLSFILTGYSGYTSAAGFIGPHNRVEHDVSLLIPEIWCRLNEHERNPDFLIQEGCLEKLEDFEYNGETILASRLGYRITKRFMGNYFGRIFNAPHAVFSEEMLCPEKQSMEDYVDGLKNIAEAQEKVAKSYLADGSVKGAIPPIEALLHIMSNGEFNGKKIDDIAIRRLFERDYVINSDWYKARLDNKQKIDIASAKRQLANLNEFKEINNQELVNNLNIDNRIKFVKDNLERYQSAEYRQSLIGTIGADILYKG